MGDSGFRSPKKNKDENNNTKITFARKEVRFRFPITEYKMSELELRTLVNDLQSRVGKSLDDIFPEYTRKEDSVLTLSAEDKKPKKKNQTFRLFRSDDIV